MKNAYIYYGKTREVTGKYYAKIRVY